LKIFTILKVLLNFI